MDSPDATFDGNRGLLTPTPTSPMRPEGRSGPVRDPIQGQSLVHLVTTVGADVMEVPASSGHDNNTAAYGTHPALTPQLAPNSGMFFTEKGVYKRF